MAISYDGPPCPGILGLTILMLGGQLSGWAANFEPCCVASQEHRGLEYMVLLAYPAGILWFCVLILLFINLTAVFDICKRRASDWK